MKRIRWWQPELWLVLALPVAALTGGALTLHAAAGDLSVAGAEAGVRRTAQVQTAQLDPDLVAARAGLHAQLRVERARGEVRVQLPPGAASPNLHLQFIHPLRADLDLRASARRDGAEWVAQLAPAQASRWRVVLADPARGWRLVGTLQRDRDALSLRPALATP